LTSTNQEIQELVNEMEEESKAIKKELYKMAWFMRGSLTFEQAFQLGYEDRMIVGDIIKENLETTKETQLPFF
jgi:hypothetical protein